MRNGSAKQTLNYRYNIRGWLQSINDIKNPGNDVFAMYLSYENTYNSDPTFDTRPLNGDNKDFTGNITGALWYDSYSGKYEPVNYDIQFVGGFKNAC